MPNAGEDLVTWYFRLNGFFVIHDFVMHGYDQNPHTTDVDVLAVRPRYVYEPIGGQENDWDLETFGRWGIDLRNETVGLIVEVKTGLVLPRTVQQKFSQHCLAYAVSRLGLLPKAQALEAVERLSGLEPAVHIGDVAIAKVLVAPRTRDAWPCMSMTLDAIESLINQRFDRYRDIKKRDRMFFPSEIIQYLAGRGRE